MGSLSNLTYCVALKLLWLQVTEMDLELGMYASFL